MAQPTLTQSLERWSAGDRSVEPELMQVVYPMLRAIAQKQLSQHAQVTIQATELANEAFLKLREGRSLTLDCRFKFMGLAARVMRNLIVDHLRERSAKKRGGELIRVGELHLDETLVTRDMSTDLEFHLDWLALDAALHALEREEPDHVQLVELRYFMGMSLEKAAEHLNVSLATANRMWRFARAFLAQWMSQRPDLRAESKTDGKRAERKGLV